MTTCAQCRDATVSAGPTECVVTRDNNRPTWRALLELPAPLALGMVLVAAVLTKSGYPFLALGGVASFQILYPLVAIVATRSRGVLQAALSEVRKLLMPVRKTTLRSRNNERRVAI